MTKSELINRKNQQNDTTTLLCRLGGWGVQYFGICLLFSPIIYTLSWIPLVGYMLAHGFSFVVAIFAFVVSVMLSSLTIGLAWLYYRPLFGAALLAIVGICFLLIFMA